MPLDRIFYCNFNTLVFSQLGIIFLAFQVKIDYFSVCYSNNKVILLVLYQFLVLYC